MAITSNCCKFLFYCKKSGANYTNTLTLGRLNLYADKKDIQECINQFNNNEKGLNDVQFIDGYSEPLLEILGAKQTDSIDYSDYEKPTIVHDLNKPVADILKNKYSVIIDGGTIEHVFNFPVAIKSCMEMLKEGGCYIGITPANNLMSHGFYQFGPELYYNVFSKENGFTTLKVLICTQLTNGSYSDWYEVVNPREIKSRITFTNSLQTYLLVLAQKNITVEIFSNTPQQSDYENVWAIKKALQENKTPPNENRLKYLYRKMTPMPLKIFIHNVYNLFTKQTVVEEGLGKINPEHFKKVVL